MIALLLWACSEYTVHEPPVVPPADPPGREPDDLGEPPDWANCTAGWWGRYSNLAADDPSIGDTGEVGEPADLDWWDDVAFERFDPTLELGSNFWPVDEGQPGDPAFHAVRWNAWMRVYDGGTVSFLLGSSDDAWVLFDREIVAAMPGIHEMDPQVFDIEVRAGQFPVEVYHAHRGSPSAGLRFRVVEGDVAICLAGE